MRKVIVTNNLNYLKKITPELEGKTIYIVLDKGNISESIKNSLSSCNDSYEIKRSEIVKNEDFIKRYSALIHRLNDKNASRVWWAMNFTSKNPFHTSLFMNVYNYLAVTKLIKERPNENLVVISSNKKFSYRLKHWASSKGVNIDISILPVAMSNKNILYRMPLFSICQSLLRVFLRKILASLFLGKPSLLSVQDYIIITLFEKSHFKTDGSFCDEYFGHLEDFFKNRNKTFTICGYASCTLQIYKDILKDIKKNGKKGVIYPLEYFITFGNIFRCLKEALSGSFGRYPLVFENANIDGENLATPLKEEIDYAHTSTQVFINLLAYYSIGDLLKQIRCKKIFYPFENRSWEKMILLASRNFSRDTVLVGYQHTSLGSKNVNFILEKGEARKIPFPDEIITMGHITKRMMEGPYNFPKSKLKVGCALRQISDSVIISGKSPEGIKRLLVVLSSDIDEYIRVLEFLDSAFSSSLPYQAVIRPHPSVDFSKAIKLYKVRNLIYEIDKSPLHDSLAASDVVLYASSTIAIEAISFGIPVVHIDLGSILSSDPLAGISYLKWSCGNPRELKATIEVISRTDKDTFTAMRKKAREFAELYCIRPTENCMEVFM